METLQISPSLDHLPRINSNDLHALQGNLKDLSHDDYARLRNSITTYGFFIPLFVWFDPATGDPYTLDGNQRLRFIRREYPLGVSLPYIQVEARDRADAKLRILLISSQYGKTTKDGFDEFIAEVNPDANAALLRDLTTFGDFLDPILPDPEPEKETPTIPFSQEIDEQSNYVILLFNNKQDWLQFTSLIPLSPVASQRSNGKPWSTGTGRILDGPSTLDTLLEHGRAA